MDTLGIIGALSFIVKVAIHAFLKYSLDKKYSFSTFGQFTDLTFFFPILEDVDSKFKTAKIIANCLYIIAVVLISIFLIFNFNHQD